MLSVKSGQVSYEKTAYDYSPKSLGLVTLTLTAALLVNLFLFGPPIKARLLDKGGAAAYASQESIVNRNLYNDLAGKMILRYPLLGVGLRNFVARMDDFTETKLLPYMHQPAHNIYLLIAAESGIAALLTFCVVIYNIVRHKQTSVLGYTLLIIVIGLLAIGFFDHYLWTTLAGSLIFWTTLGLAAGTGYNQET